MELWGKPATEESGTVPAFATPHLSRVLRRNEYLLALDEINRRAKSKCGGITILGHPGIGMHAL